MFLCSLSAVSPVVASSSLEKVRRKKSTRPVKMSDEVLVWLSVWGEVQIVRMWSS